MKGRLIIVSNRLPYKLERRGDNIEIRKSSGGLVSAIDSSLGADDNVLWVGAADFSRELWERTNTEDLQTRYLISPIFLDKKTEKKYYHGFSNTTIWPLFHYFPSYAEYSEDNYRAYREVNEQFAGHLAGIITPEDTVWVHDYHLMLLPGMLKQISNNFALGFFLHIPFPSYEILKLLPEKWRNEMLCSLLRADVIGFHTKEYVGHFRRSLTYFLGIDMNSQQHTQFNENAVLVKEYPISIDFKQFNNSYATKGVAAARRQIKIKCKGQKVIFSVDRLDYTKGVLNRLQAYEELLNERPSLKGKVVFIISVVPSREQHVKYEERRRLIEEQIGHINGLYGNVLWQPILYQYCHLTFNQLLGFYTACDVALVTPLRDGMNLVAKEFVASRKDKQGVLVLSEFAGAATELHDAVIVHPNDIGLMKEAMLKALEMPGDQQRAAIETMQTYLEANDVVKWTNDFLNDLRTNRNMNTNSHIRIMTYDERLSLFEEYRKSSRRLILLDYDGTLSPFYDLPSQAAPDQKTMDMLRDLASNERNRVVIISGRDKMSLTQWFGNMPVDLVAEHGGFYRDYTTGEWAGNEDGSEAWKPTVRAILQVYADQIRDSFIEEKKHSLAWHYRTAKGINESELIPKIVRELTISNPLNQFDVMRGNKVVEIKNIGFSKGTMASKLVTADNYDFVVAIGDDMSDEDMFMKLNGKNQYTVKVGLTSTAAMFNLIGISNVFSFLEQLTAFKNPLVLTREKIHITEHAEKELEENEKVAGA
jgi:trehalose 6-phosphate synthase/phosphatase